MGRVNLSGAQPTDVAGRAAYRVTVSPKHDGGLLGSAQLAWDATMGVPLQFAIYARGNTTPVRRAEGDEHQLRRDPGVGLQHLAAGRSQGRCGSRPAIRRATAMPPRAHRSSVTGAQAVAAAVPFKLVAPSSLVGLPRRRVTLLTMGSQRAAMVSYGENLGGMVVIERRADSQASQASRPAGWAGSACRPCRSTAPRARSCRPRSARC